MKKEKTNKFKEFLKKAKKPLTILSFAFNILFILMLIISGCSQKKKTSVVYAENNVTDLTNLMITFNDEITLPSSPVEYQVFFTTPYSESTTTEFRSIYLTNNFMTYYWLDDTDDDFTTVYYASNGWLYSPDKTIIFASGTDVTNVNLINWLYENSNLGDEEESSEDLVSYFEFNRNFNYNAPYRVSTESQFISVAYQSGVLGFEKYYDLPLFVSNGQLFNRIRLWYQYGNGVNYYDSTGTIRNNSSTNVAYYGFMNYVNTFTGYSITVNYRDFKTDYVSSNSQTQAVLSIGSTWTNNAYQLLQFYDDLTPEDATNLAQFNNYDLVNGVSTYSNDVGLGNVFVLIGSAFSGLIPLMAVEILPGLTIGLLVFLPLIIGIIILIIWLVKR